MENAVSKESTVVAFYGIKPAPGAMASFYGCVLDWFTTYGCSAGAASMHGPDYKIKMGSFRRVERKLKKTGFDEINYISLVSLLPNADIPMRDYTLTADLSYSTGDFVCAGQVSIVSLSHDFLQFFVRQIIEILNPDYGIGYKRENRLGPTLYASGLSQGLGHSGAGYLEALNISFWSEAERARIWDRGILRDVYPWNFLTAQQLSRPVDGLPLEAWINQASNRGTLRPITDSLVLWEVDEADIQPIRRTLWQADAIFNWPKHLDGYEKHPKASKVQELWS